MTFYRGVMTWCTTPIMAGFHHNVACHLVLYLVLCHFLCQHKIVNPLLLDIGVLNLYNMRQGLLTSTFWLVFSPFNRHGERLVCDLIEAAEILENHSHYVRAFLPSHLQRKNLYIWPVCCCMQHWQTGPPYYPISTMNANKKKKKITALWSTVDNIYK